MTHVNGADDFGSSQGPDDLGLINAQLAQAVTPANFLRDVNASGTISLADLGIANTNLTHALPSP